MSQLQNIFIVFLSLVLKVLCTHREISESSVRAGASYDAAQDALQFMENVHDKSAGSTCKDGTSSKLNVLFDNSEWKAQANSAVRLSNLLTKHWLRQSPTRVSIDDALLFSMTRATIEIERLIYGSAVAFEPGFYKNRSKFCAYSFHNPDGSIDSRDIQYDYFSSEWYLGSKEKAKNFTQLYQSNVTLRLSEYNGSGVKVHMSMTYFTEPVATYDDGFWTRPYLDCGGGGIWMITFNSPMFGLVNNSLDFVGVATCDIALHILDIDQCDSNHTEEKAALNIFRGTHHCKPSSVCVKKTGLGFRRGTYDCFCHPGFYFPNTSASVKAFSGFDVEKAYSSWVLNRTLNYQNNFNCVPCPELCDTCVDATPCLAEWNWIVRCVLLGITILMMISVCVIAALVVRHRTNPVFKSASAVFLLITCIGGLFVTVHGFTLGLRPSMTSCCVRIWFEHVGFALIYGPLLLKNWRIAAIFTAPGGKKIQLPDNGLLLRLLLIVTPVVVYLIVWTILASPLTRVVRDGTGLKFYTCEENWMDYALVIAESMFLLWGVYLCYQIRNVASSFNESKLIAWTIYNTIFMKNFLLIIRYFMIGIVEPDILYLMYILELQVIVSCTFVIIFGPKLYLIWKSSVTLGKNRVSGGNHDTIPESVPKNSFTTKLNPR